MQFGMGFVKEGLGWGVFLSIYMFVVNMLVMAMFPAYQNALNFGNLFSNFAGAIVPWIIAVLIYGIGFVLVYTFLAPIMQKSGLPIK